MDYSEREVNRSRVRDGAVKKKKVYEQTGEE